MRRPAVLFSIATAIGAVNLAPGASAREPIEIRKCQTIDHPGSYELVDNLTAAAKSDCLVITASFVTIDLAGFTISGTSSGLFETGTAGIRTGAPSLRGIAVRNGSISGFDAGVDLGVDPLNSADGSIVEGLRVFSGGISPITATGIIARGIVRNNTVFAGGQGGAIGATGVVVGNYAIGGYGGIGVGDGSTVIGNVASGERIGISANCPANVTNNTVLGGLVGSIVLHGENCNSTNNAAVP
jgi:hypothetical protein